MLRTVPSSYLGTVLIEGQFCGFSSLSIVNRHLARALIERGVDVRVLPTDRYEGDSELKRDGLLGVTVATSSSVDVHLRNAWPPVTHGMTGKKNGLVCWAWEESEVPPLMAERFNRDLDLIMTTAQYVSDALMRSGVRIPCPVVGNGADQILKERIPESQPALERRRLLHISTCLPRKAPCALIEGFFRAFDGRDDVELYIKTSENPHNNIRAIVDQYRAHFSNPPAVTIDESSLDSSDMVALYKSAAALVLVSKGEGFGLPLAEAMHLGVPVIAARRGGQADFCTENTALLVESRPAKSTSHVASGYGLWEEPDVGSLADAMKTAIDDPDSAQRLAKTAHRMAARTLTWAAVADRVIVALGRPKLVQPPQPQYELVTTWKEECGLATYSEQLYGAQALKEGLRHVWARRSLEADPHIDNDPSVTRLWGYDGASLQRFADSVGSSASAPVIWFQHHPGYFSPEDMRILLPALRRGRDRLLITLHNVGETLRAGADWLSGFDVIIAHSAEDVEALGRSGFRAEVLPHGVSIIAAPLVPRAETFTVGTFGFLTEHKNVELLIGAIALARRSDPRIRLVLANAQRGERQSKVVRTRIELLIKSLGLRDVVSTNFQFLENDEIVRLLAPCDLLAFPYGSSPEGASGAARMAIALDRPTLLSDSGVFRDLMPFSHSLRRLDVETLADAILGLAQDDDMRGLHDRSRRSYAETHSWERVGQRAAALMRIAQ
ncbi:MULTISPECIES: glycosyltransferase family 4 protein [unclassified Brevundimonas]|uniref:glycosyltransferase family 4 protein n=1 Tax=unclassified Brevundimonas TaxID=2622653 RepID=UPI0025C43420|nr:MULTISPECIES: glycosyltransferase [unclassified Brevundimonas]